MLYTNRIKVGMLMYVETSVKMHIIDEMTTDFYQEWIG